MSDDQLSDERVVSILNKSFEQGKNPSISTLCGLTPENKIISYDRNAATLIMVFHGDAKFSNGKPGGTAQVQGGFAGAMLDAVTAQAVVVHSKLKFTVATLEQKCSFIRPVPLGAQLYGIARIVKIGKTIAFLESELRHDSVHGDLLVTSSTTIALVPLPSRKPKTPAKI